MLYSSVITNTYFIGEESKFLVAKLLAQYLEVLHKQ